MRNFSLLLPFTLSASALAFAPHPQQHQQRQWQSISSRTEVNRIVACEASTNNDNNSVGGVTRSSFFFSAAATLAGGIMGVVSAPDVALAAKYGSFGAGSSQVLNPLEADIDRSMLASKEVQDALKRVKSFQDVVTKMQAAVNADAQFNVRPILLKELDAAPLRAALNTVNAIFDEESTQRGTDRLIRVILQDITELEVANAQKEGIPRSERRLENVKGKLTKLNQAFEDYLAFAK